MMRIRSTSTALRWMGRTASVWMMLLTFGCSMVRSGDVASGAGQSGAAHDASGGSATGSPAEPSPPDALATVARYTAGKQVPAAELVRKLGYTPPMAESAWLGLPAVRQIELAFRAAEAADADRGGQFFLAALIRDLIPISDAVKKEPTLARYLKLATLLGPFRFKQPPAAQAQARLPDEVAQTIKLLAEYASRSSLGSQHQILVKYFKLSSDAASQLFAGEQSYAQLLQQALGKVDAAQQNDVVRSIAIAVATHYEAARREPSLKPFLANWSPPEGKAAPETFPEPSAAENSAAGILRDENPGTVAFDLYLNRKLLGRIGTGVGASFTVPPGIHSIEWRETEANSPFSDPQPLNVTAGNVHTLKAPRIQTCTRSCAGGTCGPWECPPGLTPPSG